MQDKLDRYILGVDGGGTKTLAKLVNTRTQQAWQKSGGSASLSNDFDAAVCVITQLCQALAAQASCQLHQIDAVFGIAGAASDMQQQRCYQAFNDSNIVFNRLAICSDAKTSVYGANLGEPIVVVALGTGSVGMRLSTNGQCTLTGGWGFLLGDEGSGAKLGLNALKIVLEEIQQQEHYSKIAVLSLLAQSICLVTGKTKAAIIQWAKQATPADFATFSPDIFALQHRCKKAKQLLKQHTHSVEKLIKESRYNSDLPVVLLGGLATPTAALLTKSTQNLLTPAQGSALDGACLLANM